MTTVPIRQAAADLPELMARAEAGEDILIAREDGVMVRLTPVTAPARERRPGTLKGKIEIPDEFFFEPLPDDELARWDRADASAS